MVPYKKRFNIDYIYSMLNFEDIVKLKKVITMAVILEIKVVPQSGKQALQVDAHGVIKCYIKSAPEKGKANKELVKFLAKELGLTQRDIEIVSGLTDRKKRIHIVTKLTYEQVLQKLGLEKQENLFDSL